MGGMTTSPLREGARVIALDDAQRVLLLRYPEGGGYFSAPVKPRSAPNVIPTLVRAIQLRMTSSSLASASPMFLRGAVSVR
jgi:hypothetical protein